MSQENKQNRFLVLGFYSNGATGRLGFLAVTCRDGGQGKNAFRSGSSNGWGSIVPFQADFAPSLLRRKTREPLGDRGFGPTTETLVFSPWIDSWIINGAELGFLFLVHDVFQ